MTRETSRHHVAHNQRLNELAVLLGRSFLQYLAYTSPYVPPAAQGVWAELGSLADRQQAHAEELLDLLSHRRYVPVDSAFPMEFAVHHYVALDYLMKPLIEDQEKRVARIQLAAHELADDTTARPLLEKIAAAEELLLNELIRLSPSGA